MIRKFTVKENHIGLAVSEMVSYRQTDILLLFYGDLSYMLNKVEEYIQKSFFEIEA